MSHLQRVTDEIGTRRAIAQGEKYSHSRKSMAFKFTRNTRLNIPTSCRRNTVAAFDLRVGFRLFLHDARSSTIPAKRDAFACGRYAGRRSTDAGDPREHNETSEEACGRATRATVSAPPRKKKYLETKR